MPTQETEETEAEEFTPNRAARRAKVKSNRATLSMLRSKKPQEKEVAVAFPDGAGGTEDATFLFRSIGAKEWELLVAKYPPTSAQRAEGQPFNTDTFPPALLSRVCVDPALSEEDWVEIWSSPDWNRGEIADLYGEAVALCTAGFNIPFRGSA
jgi:hypothetical protein